MGRVSGVTKYEAQHRIGDATDWTALPETESVSTTHAPGDGLPCGTAYRFRVRAFGDGVMHSVEWGTPSSEETHATEACNQDPVFDPDSYEFTVDEDAAVGDNVGTVTASDLDEGDTVSYSISSGNEAGQFSIDYSTGDITVVGALDYETTTSYTLTLEADDAKDGTDTATVNIAVGDVAEDAALAADDLSVSLADGVFTLAWSEVEGASRYEAQHRASDTEEWTALRETETAGATYAPEGGPACETTYQFRVRSYGDGVVYAEDWGAESAPETYETEDCNQDPDFDSDSYSFSVDETSSTGALIGTIGASDPDEEDSVSYSITSGNRDGRFTLTEDTGEITLDATLDQTSVSSYTLTVRAEDGNGGEDTASVAITVTSVCRDGTVIPDPGANPDLVEDCLILYGARETLAGTASLDWNGNTALTEWEGVRVRGTPGRVQYLLLPDLQLDGIIPPALGGLSELRRIDLDVNSLTGRIPSELRSLTHLTHLYLQENSLNGGIPAELGNLRSLQVLYLQDNQLTSGIPAALSNLARLRQLVLGDNQLTGSIPSELGSLDRLGHLLLADNRLTGQIPKSLSRLNLENIALSGNSFQGCIPEGLPEVTNNDLHSAEFQWMPSCAPTFYVNSYSFTVSEDASVGDVVGTVYAEANDLSSISYAITAGNDDEKFQLNADSGALTVVGTLDHETTPSYSLTVQAMDGAEQTSDITATIRVTDVAE